MCPIDSIQGRLDVLRTDLADLAYDLERRGQPEAADVAMMIRARLLEFAEGPARMERPDDANLLSL